MGWAKATRVSSSVRSAFMAMAAAEPRPAEAVAEVRAAVVVAAAAETEAILVKGKNGDRY